MKDYFIPHAGNNYKPKALHPKRVLFHAVGALAAKAVVVAFALFFPLSAWLTPDVLAEEGRKIVALINELRLSVGSAPLKENALLGRAAYGKAQDMLIRQYFSHIDPDGGKISGRALLAGYRFGVIGENLAMGFASAEEIMNGWIKSKTHYDNLIDKDFSEIGVGLASGSYGGYDTTLAAAVFASPSAPAASSSRENAVIALPSETDNSSQRVLSVKESLPVLAAPVIIFPPDKYLTNREAVRLEVFAPLAEKAVVYVNGQPMAAAKDLKTDSLFFDLSFSEGVQEIKVKAIRGGEERESALYQFTIDRTAPLPDLSKTEIIVSAPGAGQELVVQAEAVLSPDAVSASLSLGDFNISLEKDAKEIGLWKGQAMIFREDGEALFSPVVPATLAVSDAAGNAGAYDIDWKNIAPIKSSLLSRYFFLRTSAFAPLKKVLDLSAVYYKILLIIVSVSLLLNIFIEIKKQHPHIIMSAFGFIAFLILLIIV